MKDSESDRRKFLKSVGLGWAAMASLPSLSRGKPLLIRPASGPDTGGTTNWIFAAIENANFVNGIQFRVLLEGHGFITPSNSIGQGSYVEINNNTPVPHTILSSGTWKTTALDSASIIGTYGSLAAGKINMEINLVQDFPTAAVIPATLNLVCNIPAANLFTGEDEGYFLTISGSPSGTFAPPVVVGGTVFSTENEARNGS